jgi:hypothetical protein
MGSVQERIRGIGMIRFLTPALMVLRLLNCVPAEATPLGILESQAPLINQTERQSIVKAAEACCTGYFRDGFG